MIPLVISYAALAVNLGSAVFYWRMYFGLRARKREVERQCSSPAGRLPS